MSTQKELLAWDRGFYSEIHSSRHLAPIRHLYDAPFESLKEHKDFFWVHNRAMWAMVRNLSQKAIDITVKGIDEYICNQLKIPRKGLSEGGKIDSINQFLNANSYTALPSIDKRKISNIQTYLEEQQCYPGRYNLDSKLYSLEEVRKKRPYIAHYPLSTVLKCPNLFSIVNHPTIISTVAKYLGTIPTIVDYSAWWSFSQRGEPEEAQLFHFDLADYKFCTLMIYITEVNNETGPHVIVEGSHDLGFIKEIQNQQHNNKKIFDDWYFYQQRKTDQEVKDYFKKEPTLLTGSAGTNFLVAPRAIHKGAMPETSDRLVCQVVYCCTPQLQTKLRPLAWGTPETSNIPSWLKTEPFRYINRLFLEAK